MTCAKTDDIKWLCSPVSRRMHLHLTADMNEGSQIFCFFPNFLFCPANIMLVHLCKLLFSILVILHTINNDDYSYYLLSPLLCINQCHKFFKYVLIYALFTKSTWEINAIAVLIF